MNTWMPIICNQVAANSLIWTGEHRSYGGLHSYNYGRGTVGHKYQFTNITGVNTQSVASFNNIIKVEIKSRKGT